jgi:hypothetical protein
MLDNRKIENGFAVGEGDFCSSRSIQTKFFVLPAAFRQDLKTNYPPLQQVQTARCPSENGWSLKPSIYFHLVPTLRMPEAVTPFFHMCCGAIIDYLNTVKILIFTFTCLERVLLQLRKVSYTLVLSPGQSMGNYNNFRISTLRNFKPGISRTRGRKFTLSAETFDIQVPQ